MTEATREIAVSNEGSCHRPGLDEIGLRVVMGLRSRGIWAWLAKFEPDPYGPDAVYVVVPAPNREIFYQICVRAWQLREEGIGGIVARKVRHIIRKERRAALGALSEIVRVVSSPPLLRPSGRSKSTIGPVAKSSGRG